MGSLWVVKGQLGVWKEGLWISRDTKGRWEVDGRTNGWTNSGIQGEWVGRCMC